MLCVMQIKENLTIIFGILVNEGDEDRGEAIPGCGLVLVNEGGTSWDGGS